MRTLALRQRGLAALARARCRARARRGPRSSAGGGARSCAPCGATATRALVRFTARFDGVRLAPAPAARARGRGPRASRARADPRGGRSAARAWRARIEAYPPAAARRAGSALRLADGSLLEEVVRPLASVGLYVPGGAGRLSRRRC